MNDFDTTALCESRNEWCARLLTLLTPLFMSGFQSIFRESAALCTQTNEMGNVLKTFQNLLARVPKWNAVMVEEECASIKSKSNCDYLEDLIACIHIIHLKMLTAIRVGHNQKKIAIDIPKLNVFIHKAYINCSRKIYKNVYLFKPNEPPLVQQQLNHQLELLIQGCILDTIRDSIPVENILKVYMNESIEDDIVELKEELIDEPATKIETVPPIGPLPILAKEEEIKQEEKKEEEIKEKEISTALIIRPETTAISFNDLDLAVTENGQTERIDAPKTIEKLEEISIMRNNERKAAEEQEQEEDGGGGIELDFSNLDLSFGKSGGGTESSSSSSSVQAISALNNIESL